MLLSWVQHLTDVRVKAAPRLPRLSPWGAAPPPEEPEEARRASRFERAPSSFLSRPPSPWPDCVLGFCSLQG